MQLRGDLMEKWIMSIVGVVILTALFELFMVEGETKNILKEYSA